MEKPIIPNRVPLKKPEGTGPKVAISKYPTINKNMASGSETTHGAKGARPQTRAPEGLGTPGMIKVKMDGSRSVVIDRPTVAPRQTPPARVAPRVAPPVANVVDNEGNELPEFALEHAELCIRLLGEHYKMLTETDNELSEAEAYEAKLTEETAGAIAGIVARLPPPAPPEPPPPPRGVSPLIAQSARFIAASPRGSVSGIAPKRTPRPTPLPSSGHVPDDLAAAMQGPAPADTDLDDSPPDGDEDGGVNGVHAPEVASSDTDLA